MSNNNFKSVLITGASSGIGKETAKLFLEGGYKVFAAARRVEEMKDLLDAGARVFHLDITDEKSIQELVNTLETEEAGVDVLVNNAGYGLYGAVEQIEIQEARNQFEVNLFGLARLTQLLLPGMRKRKQGRIINISSVGGRIVTPLGAWYHATKHALEGFSDCLRFELAPFGIEVVVIQPGPIKTPWSDTALDTAHNHSAHGPYRDLANRVNQRVSKMYSGNSISGPEAVAKTILKAVKAKKPKTRYPSGKMAAFFLFLRKNLSDRMFDFLLRMNYR